MTIIVGVTGISATDNPTPGMGVARSLKEYAEQSGQDIKIAGLAYDAMDPGIYMDQFIDKSFLIPYVTAAPNALFDRLKYIKQSFGLDALIPTLDSELPFFMKFHDEVHQTEIKTFLPTEEQFALRGKDKIEEIAKNSGLLAPKQRVISTFEEISDAVEDIGLPLMVKGSLYKAYRASTTEEVMSYFSKVAAEWGYPVILQAMIHGQEVNVIGVGDGSGGVSGMVAIKKTSVTELGKIWTGVTIYNEALLEGTRAFVAHSRWRGAFEMECMLIDNKVYLIEINPRFPAWVYFATGVGINLPAVLLEHALERSVPEFSDYSVGKLYVRYVGEKICEMSNFQKIVTTGET